MPRKSTPPVSSFGPELLAALLRGGQQELRIPVPNFQTAFALRQRFYALRKSMKAESHPQLAMAQRACIPLPQEQHDKTALLIIRPHDDEFANILRAAGVQAEELNINPLVEIEEPVEGAPPPSWLDGILAHVEV